MTTSDAQQKASKKFDDKTYKKILVAFRKADDADMIADIEEAKARGISYREYFRGLYEKSRKKS